MSVLDTVFWMWPWAFALLPLALLVYWLGPAARARRLPALKVPDMDRYEGYSSTAHQTHWRYWLRLLLLSLAWIALVVATARPQTYSEPLGVPITGRDLLLCIDISGSMRETDLYAGNTRATRMAVVKQVAMDFVARRTGDRIGLILFGSQAYVQTPLTHDHETVQHFLAEAAVGLAGRSTAIGDAIGLAVKRLRDRPDSSRVLILLTDGENTPGFSDPIEAARVAAQFNIRIHTIGVGSERNNRGFGQRRAELDEDTLNAISRATGGQYFRARNQQELQRIYRDIDRLEPNDQDQQEFRPLSDLFMWPLSISLLLSVLWALTGSAGMRWNAHGTST